MTAPATAAVTVARPAEQIWDMVADLTRMGEWSPNCKGARWDDGATGPQVGAVFTGLNQAGEHDYETRNRIVACDRPRILAWETSFDGTDGWSRWTYIFEPTAEGTLVTETWEPLELERLRGRPVTEKEVAQMAQRWTGAMQETLAGLRAVAER